MFYIASLGFSIVPGMFTANGIRVNYESTPDGIKMTKDDGESMVLPFRQAMHMVSTPIMPNVSNVDKPSEYPAENEK